MFNTLQLTVKTVVKSHPEILSHLTGRAFWFAVGCTGAKSYDYFLSNIERLVRSVYDGNLGGDFVEIMKDLILGQISDAYETAWVEDGNELPPPEYLQEAAHTAIQDQYEHVTKFYRDVVDARVDQTGIDSLLSRAQLWANRWTENYNNAVHLIAVENGEKEEWVLGETEEHCETCYSLSGVVAYAREWEALNVHPQGAPNDKLECGGWKCDCRRQQTDKRRSPKAFDTIMNIVNK